jgi:flotillin
LITQGAVRKVLASAEINQIMVDRSTFGDAFTREVKDQLEAWGVETVKAMELMDIRDGKDSQVIANIMAMKTSYIAMASKKEVADNNKAGEIAVLDARRAVAIREQETEEAIAQRTAEKERNVGIAQQESHQAVETRENERVQAVGISKQTAEEAVQRREVTKEQTVGVAQQQAEQQIAEQKRIAAEKAMAVLRVQKVEAERIAKETAEVLAEKERQIQVINAQAAAEVVEKQAYAAKVKQTVAAQAYQAEVETKAAGDANRVKVTAEADAEQRKIIAEAEAARIKQEGTANAEITSMQGKAEADAKKAIGLAQAEAENKMQSAKVQGQIDLAKEIGSNAGYQQYLVALEAVKAAITVGTEQSKALAAGLDNANINVIANTGQSPVEGVSGVMGMFTPQGATNLNAWIKALGQSDEGRGVLDALMAIIGRVAPSPAKAEPEQDDQNRSVS